MENKFNRLFRLYHLALQKNPYLYFELAHTRQTGWMGWLIDKSGGGRNVLVSSQDDSDEPDAHIAVLEPILAKLEEMGLE